MSHVVTSKPPSILINLNYRSNIIPYYSIIVEIDPFLSHDLFQRFIFLTYDLVLSLKQAPQVVGPCGTLPWSIRSFCIIATSSSAGCACAGHAAPSAAGSSQRRGTAQAAPEAPRATRLSKRSRRRFMGNRQGAKMAPKIFGICFSGGDDYRVGECRGETL